MVKSRKIENTRKGSKPETQKDGYPNKGDGTDIFEKVTIDKLNETPVTP